MTEWNGLDVQDILKSNIRVLTLYKIDLQEAQKPTMRNQDYRLLLSFTEERFDFFYPR